MRKMLVKRSLAIIILCSVIAVIVFFAICYFGVEKIYFDEGRYIEIMKRFREKRVIIWYLSVLGWMFGFTLIGALISIL